MSRIGTVKNVNSLKMDNQRCDYIHIYIYNVRALKTCLQRYIVRLISLK